MVLRPEGTGGFSLKGKGRDGFSWQSRYGAFPVSQSARVTGFLYIAEQEIHHRGTNFPLFYFLD
jgi:hypothetical protein